MIYYNAPLSQTRRDSPPTGKIGPKIFPSDQNIHPYGKNQPTLRYPILVKNIRVKIAQIVKTPLEYLHSELTDFDKKIQRCQNRTIKVR